MKIPVTFHVKGIIEHLEAVLSEIDKGSTERSKEDRKFFFQLLLVLKESEAKGTEEMEVAEVQKRLPQYSNIIETLAEGRVQ